MAERSELHCHTKMSEMSGVADVFELIKKAKGMGMPGIAITDNDGVCALPYAYQEWKWEMDYSEINSSFKILFGAELGIVDNLNNNEMATKNPDAIKKLPPYCSIFIAHNRKGLKNLYELITASYTNYCDQRPNIVCLKCVQDISGM